MVAILSQPELKEWYKYQVHIDGLVQERCNSIANALELRLSCTNHQYLSSFKTIQHVTYLLENNFSKISFRDQWV